MRFTFDAEQDDLRAVLREFLAERAPLASLRGRGPLGDPAVPYDPETWRAMAEGFGLQAVDVPEALGGTGLSVVELACVLELAGEQLYPGPLLASTGQALGLLLAVHRRHAAPVEELVTSIAAGRVVVAAVSGAVTATGDDRAGYTLDGVEPFVLQADCADDLLVTAELPGGDLGLFAVRPADVDVTVLPGIDPTRATGRVELLGAPGRLLATGVDGAVREAGLRAGVATAAEALGAARRCLDEARGYAASRTQFGVAIGTFQGVKHRLADTYVDVELATSAVYLAACHVAQGDLGPAAASVPLAVLAATEALARAARDSVQVHGGIGFTWEHDAHLFVKRAQAARLLSGGPAEQLAQIWEHGPELLAPA